MINKKYFNCILVLSICICFISCDDLLEPYIQAEKTGDDVWKYQEMAQGMVGYAYEFLPRTYNEFIGNRSDLSCDNGASSSVTDVTAKFAEGNLLSQSNPFNSYWSSYYKAIANLNRFLYDDNGVKTRYYLDAKEDSLFKYRLKGEAFGLRAYFYWQLLKVFGGVGVSSNQLLGVPLFTDIIELSDKDSKRATYKETMDQIKNDCDSAYKYLPIAHRDFLLNDVQKNYPKIFGSSCWGRIDGITTRAILAEMYLTYASPLFNPDNDKSRWETAAKYAREVVKFKLEKDNVKNGFNPKNFQDWHNANASDAVFISRRLNNSDASSNEETTVYPKMFGGGASYGPTQELVDSYPMSNGYPIDDPRSGYDPNDPYNNRDKRFYRDIFYCNSVVNRLDDASKPMYTFETWKEADGTLAKDAPGNIQTTRTGYYNKKMVYLGWNSTDRPVQSQTVIKYFYRWSDVLLDFAEAVNEFGGPDYEIDGMSAKKAISYIRNRNITASVASPYASGDPYFEEAALDKDSFAKLIKNERRIELSFQGYRYFDVRRWSRDGDFSLVNQPIHGVIITKNEDGTLSYDFNNLINNRKYPSLYNPIPISDLLKDKNLEQNKGWEAWQ